MTRKEILRKLRSIRLCLTAHPDYEEGSEFEDRANDIVELEETKKKDKA